MTMRTGGAVLLCGLWAAAAQKGPPAAEAANELVRIRATLLADRPSLARELGSDLGGLYTVLRLEIAPRKAQELAISPEDFRLRSDKDGQRTGPLAPSQIAGRDALVVSSKGGGGLMAENPGPVWGGWPGPPRRLGGQSTVMGNTSETGTQASAQTGPRQPEDPLLAALKAKALPETTAAAPVSGLLYFFLEGKHKPKNLELLYDGPAGKLSLRFRQ